ncbi:type Z 30S ribosomal protein S14 [Candidatus Dojkabacteria bacterium]|jgi:small subunit ribosomal protein S14|nr:type Z 30S ribosomal protein S14 [Candidatus Dojkabacteria bacterium]
MSTEAKEVKQRMLKIKSKYPTRVYNRCANCGRSRGYIRMFGMCRICFRKMASAGEIPGVKKSIW